MDDILTEKLTKWYDHINVLKKSESDVMNLESSERALFAVLFLNSGDGSVAVRESVVHSSSEWASFQKGLVEAKVRYNKDKRILELLQKAFDAEYLTYKLEHDAIKKFK